MTPEDLAWVATDLLTLAIDEEFPDPDYLAVSFREAVPAGREQMLFDGMARGEHPDTVDVLNHLGEYHPDKQVAKAARTPRTKPPRAAVSPANVVIGPARERRPDGDKLTGEGRR